MSKEETLQDKIALLEQENKDLRNLNSSLLRQCKEKANADKGLHPKKEHSGYLLVSSNPKEIRYQSSGKVSTADIYETVLQTPFGLDISYYDVIKISEDDLTKKREDGSLLKSLGVEYLKPYCKYQDLYGETEFNKWLEELLDEYRNANNLISVPLEVIDEKKNDLEIEFDNSCFNYNARINGKAGYWEVIFQHKFPLDAVPRIMRFQNKKEDKK